LGRRDCYAPRAVGTWAVVVAAGSGSRFGAPKQFADLAGRPVLEWSLESARRACAEVVLVLPAEHVRDDATTTWDADVVVAGGATRSASVRAGLNAVPDDADIIVVHDSARPLATPGLWRAVIDAVAGGADGAIAATPVTDTVKEVGADGRLVTLDRDRLVSVQTPQAFKAAVLRRAHSAANDATDDAALVEAIGGQVVVVHGPSENLKVTSATDLIVAAALIGARR
jgi:2-C-methyl-D-erythritol 4-phosphate cytidylyltransferase